MGTNVVLETFGVRFFCRGVPSLGRVVRSGQLLKRQRDI